MSKRHLLRSAYGIDHYIETDELDGGTRFHSVAATDPVIEQNKAMRTHNDGYSPSRELRRVASIPFIIGLQWLNEEGWWFLDAGHDPDVAVKLARKLNDPDWAYLRTADGQVGVSNGVMR
jgi:hypothetical protein